MTGTGTRTADLYLRLSDARTEDALDGREAKLRAEAARLGWSVARVVVENDLAKSANGRSSASAFKRKKILLPNGKTELRTIRPGFRSVLDDLAGGRADALLTEDLDRMMRQPRDGEDLLDAVELSGATCRSLSGSLTLTDGGTDSERFTARILVSVANKSSADTSRRVSAARERLAGQSWGGGRRPYGYVPDPDSQQYHRKLIVVEAEAEVIRAAADGILERGISLKAIARDLRERNVPTVTGAAWTAETVRDVLSKRALTGLQDDQGNTVIPAILDRDRQERLTALFESRKNPGTGNEPRWLLSMTALCGVCGSSCKCTGSSSRRAYTCTEHGHVRRNAVEVDKHVSAYITERLSRDDVADLLRPPARPGTDTPKLRTELRKLRERKAALARVFALDGDEAALSSGVRAIRDRMAKIEVQLAASDQPDPLAEFRDKPAAAVWASLPLPRKRAVVRLLATVTILPAGRRGNRFDPESVKVTPRA